MQAEDRCHRPGQRKDVYVHYILSAGTMEMQMWDLINQKAAAQRAVFDKEALYKNVEDVMAEAVSAQMQVAQAVVDVERTPLSVQSASDSMSTQKSPPASSTQKSSVGAKQLSLTALFQKHGSQGRRRRKRQVTEQQVSFFDMLAQAVD